MGRSYHPCNKSKIFARAAHQSPRQFYATLLPFGELPPPLDLSLPLVVPDDRLEFSAPPSCAGLCLLTSGFAGLTSRGLFDD